jgi:hypothetical protein
VKPLTRSRVVARSQPAAGRPAAHDPGQIRQPGWDRVLRCRFMILPFVSGLRQRLGRDHLLIACMPKSGATYLHTVLRKITGLDDASLCELGDQNEGDICEKRLRRLRRRSVILQHVMAVVKDISASGLSYLHHSVILDRYSLIRFPQSGRHKSQWIVLEVVRGQQVGPLWEIAGRSVAEPKAD